MSQISYVNLSDLSLPTFQAHSVIPPDYLTEISNSIKSVGVIEPLIIRNTDTGLEIVCGCVRYKAAKLAGLQAVPCINLDLDPQAAEVIKLHENIKRLELNHVDQGNTFLMMSNSFKMTESEIAFASGRSIGYVSQHISLVRHSDDLTLAVKDNSITFSQSRELMRIRDLPERSRLLRFCQENGASIRVLKDWVNESLRSSSPPAPHVHSSKDSFYDSEPQNIERICEACHNPVDINNIRQVFYCKPCHSAIKSAIDDQNSKKPD